MTFYKRQEDYEALLTAKKQLADEYNVPISKISNRVVQVHMRETEKKGEDFPAESPQDVEDSQLEELLDLSNTE